MMINLSGVPTTALQERPTKVLHICHVVMWLVLGVQFMQHWCIGPKANADWLTAASSQQVHHVIQC